MPVLPIIAAGPVTTKDATRAVGITAIIIKSIRAPELARAQGHLLLAPRLSTRCSHTQLAQPVPGLHGFS